MGYRTDTHFGEMPKLFMDLSADGYKIHDSGQELPMDSITVTATPNRSEVCIPLALLGDPERIMVSAHTNQGDVPLDNIPWVFLKITQELLSGWVGKTSKLRGHSETDLLTYP